MTTRRHLQVRWNFPPNFRISKDCLEANSFYNLRVCSHTNMIKMISSCLIYLKNPNAAKKPELYCKQCQ